MDNQKFRQLVTKNGDFTVKEVPKKKFFLKFERSAAGIMPVKGPYTLFLLEKKGMTTEQAVRRVAARLAIPVKEIGYAGLKDKHAATSQYVTIKNASAGFRENDMSLTPVGKTNRHINIGDLEGNFFEIRVQRLLGGKMSVLKKPVPNYFGFQRFGTGGKNSAIGLLILRRQYEQALEAINEIQNEEFADIREAGRKRLKFFVHAYQSDLFNKVLKGCIINKRKTKEKIKVPGYGSRRLNSRMGRLLASDSIRTQDFAFPDLGFACRGYERKAFIMVKDLSWKESDGATALSFFLPSGSYATTIIEAIL
jgi:tRNA pseudouridine13 synthase